MSYVKLPTVVSDFAVGIQSMQQASDNADALKDVLDAEHALGNGGFNTSAFTNPLNEVGRHDDNLIARTVAHCYIDNTGGLTRLSAYFAGPVLGSLTYRRLGTGQWQMYLQAPFLFFGVASMPATASVDYQPRTYRSYDPQFGSSLIVSTWAIDSGSWVLDDLDFDLAIWLQR